MTTGRETNLVTRCTSLCTRSRSTGVTEMLSIDSCPTLARPSEWGQTRVWGISRSSRTKAHGTENTDETLHLENTFLSGLIFYLLIILGHRSQSISTIIHDTQGCRPIIIEATICSWSWDYIYKHSVQWMCKFNIPKNSIISKSTLLLHNTYARDRVTRPVMSQVPSSINILDSSIECRIHSYRWFP